MSQIDTMEALRYGGSLIVYLLAVYLGGGFILLVGFVMTSAGTGGPFSSGNLGLVLLGLLIVLAGYVVMLAGTLGIGYKLIVDGVARGVDNSSAAGRLLAEE